MKTIWGFPEAVDAISGLLSTNSAILCSLSKWLFPSTSLFDPALNIIGLVSNEGFNGSTAVEVAETDGKVLIDEVEDQVESIVDSVDTGVFKWSTLDICEFCGDTCK